MTLEELQVIIDAETAGLRQELKSVQGQLGGLDKSVGSVTRSINKAFSGAKRTLAALGIGKLIQSSTNSAMVVETSIQQINRSMNVHSREFLAWANTQAAAFGMAEGEAFKYGAVYSNLISGFEKDTKKVSNYTTDLLKTSAIVASGTGRTMSDTMDRIRSGLLGNTESIEDLGINVNIAMIESTEAFKRFANGRSWQQLDFQTQQQIRLFAIMEQASKKYGDSLNQNTASAQQQFVAQLKNIQNNLGSAFLPIYNAVLPALTDFATQVASTMKIVSQFMATLFGTNQAATNSGNVTKSAAQANADLAQSYTDAGKAAKKAQGFLAGFDEVNSVNNKETDAIGSGATTGMNLPADVSSINNHTTEVVTRVQELANKVRETMEDIKEFFSSHSTEIISVVGGVASALVASGIISFISSVSASLPALGAALAAVLSPATIAIAAIGLIAGELIYLYQTNENFRNQVNEVWADIGETLTSLWNDVFKPVGEHILNEFIIPIAKAFQDNIVPVLGEMFIGASQILNDLVNLVKSIFENVWTIIQPAMDLIKNIVIDVLEIIKDLWDMYGQTLISNLREFVQGIQDTLQLLWDNVLYPIIQPFLEMLSWLWDKHLKSLVKQVGEFVMKCVNGALELYNGFIKPIVDWIIKEFGPPIANAIAFVGDVFGTVVAAISDIVKGLFKILGGIVDFIVGIFTGNWKKAWEGVKDIFKGIWDTFVGIVKAPINLIIDMVNHLIRSLNTISFSIPDWDWLPDGIQGKSFGINIPAVPKLARGGIVDSPTLAMIGERGKEAVVPLENTSFVDKLASALGSAVIAAMQFGSRDNDTQGDIILQIDGTTFARIIGPFVTSEESRQGTPMILKPV